MLKCNSSHTSKIFNNIIKLIKVRKNQAAFHPNATQYTLNLGNNFFGIWRQSIDKKQSIFGIYNVTNTNQKLNINKLNILSLENWFNKNKHNVIDSYWNLLNGFNYENASEIFDFILSEFNESKYDKISIIYNEFKCISRYKKRIYS